MCPECEKERVDFEKDRENREKRQKIEVLKRKSNIGKRYINSSLKNFNCENDHQKNIVNTMNNYIERHKELVEKGVSFIFSGKPGTGKTHLACAIGNALINKLIEVGYVSIFSLITSLKASFDKNSGDSEVNIIKKYTSVDFLIIDEIGVQLGSNYEKSIMFQIINFRYEMIRPTILITNLNEEQSKEIIGERIVDRFYENGGGFYSFNWESHRRKRVEK
jgi:DNA replication protein DnaC